MNQLRRNFLKRLSFLPFGFGLKSAQHIEENTELAPVEIALTVVRLFNTAEAHCYLKHGGYASADDLFRMLAAAWFINPPDRRTGHAKSFFSYLRLNDEEIIPGWKMRIIKFEGSSGYLLSLIRIPSSITGKTENTVFVSDQIGVIYLGDSDSQYDPERGPREAAAVPGLAPIDVKLAPRGLAALLQRLAFASQGVQPDICGCSCTCQNTAQCYCANSGCRNCGWCCSTGCTGCSLCSVHACTCCT